MSKQKTTEQFVEDARRIHGDKYDYSSVVYEGAKTKVLIQCPTHGTFDQTPNNHINKRLGCRYCTKTGIVSNTEEFVKKSKIIHGDTYSYKQVEYRKHNQKVEIICCNHGTFEQTPSAHLQGQGCPTCKQEKLLGGYNKKFFQEDMSRRDIKGRLYLVMLENEKEKFLKLGITKYTVGSRFCKGKGFNVQSLFDQCMNIGQAYEIEQQIKSVFSKERFKPITSFAGKTECFPCDMANVLLDTLSKEIGKRCHV